MKLFICGRVVSGLDCVIGEWKAWCSKVGCVVTYPVGACADGDAVGAGGHGPDFGDEDPGTWAPTPAWGIIVSVTMMSDTGAMVNRLPKWNTNSQTMKMAPQPAPW